MLTWPTTATTTTKRPRTPKRPTPCPCCTQCCHFQTLYKFCAENLQRFHWRIYCRWNSAVWKAPNQPYTTPPPQKAIEPHQSHPPLGRPYQPNPPPTPWDYRELLPRKKGIIKYHDNRGRKVHVTLYVTWKARKCCGHYDGWVIWSKRLVDCLRAIFPRLKNHIQYAGDERIKFPCNQSKISTLPSSLCGCYLFQSASDITVHSIAISNNLCGRNETGGRTMWQCSLV